MKTNIVTALETCTSGQPSYLRWHPTCWASSQRSHTVSSAACECGAEEQTVDHVILCYPMHRSPHGLHGLMVLDDEKFEWLINTCPEIYFGLAMDKNSLKRWGKKNTMLKKQRQTTCTIGWVSPRGRKCSRLYVLINCVCSRVKIRHKKSEATAAAKSTARQGRSEVRWRSGQETIWRPILVPKVFWKQMCWWRKYLRHCWDFSAPPAVIQRPGNCAPLAPSLRPCCLWTTQHNKHTYTVAYAENFHVGF